MKKYVNTACFFFLAILGTALHAQQVSPQPIKVDKTVFKKLVKEGQGPSQTATPIEAVRLTTPNDLVKVPNQQVKRKSPAVKTAKAIIIKRKLN